MEPMVISFHLIMQIVWLVEYMLASFKLHAKSTVQIGVLALK